MQIDASWLLVAVLIVWTLAAGYFPATAPGFAAATYWWMGVAGLIGLAFSIVIHEMAHALVARRYDMPIRGITLFVFGGVAEMASEPTSAKGEFWMALAGPAMSAVVAGAFFLLAVLAGGGAAEPTAIGVVLAYLAVMNLLLVLFNLVPAFPLDGGRVLRAALWAWKGDILWATRIAATAGSAFAFLLMALGLLNAIGGNLVGGIWWFVLGLFVNAAASGHLQHQVTRSVLEREPVSRFMRRDPVEVSPALPLDRLVSDYFYRFYFKSFPVVQNGRLVGCIAVEAVKAVPADELAARTVGDAMEPCGADSTIAPEADAASALRQMQSTGKSRLLVMRAGQLVGVLSLRDLLNYLAIRMDLEGVPGGDRPQSGERRATLTSA